MLLIAILPSMMFDRLSFHRELSWSNQVAVNYSDDNMPLADAARHIKDHKHLCVLVRC
jgi:hypothetical protein